MTFQPIADYLQEPLLDASIFEAFWETTQAGFPGCDQIPFLKPAAIEEALHYAQVVLEQLPRLLAMARRVEATPPLARLAWHAHRRLVAHAQAIPGNFTQWPTLLPLLGKEEAGLFYFLIALSSVPQLRRLHAALGIDECVSRNTARVVAAIFHAYERYSPPEAEGRPLRYLDWMRHHLAGKIFRLGRMEWLMAPFAGLIHVYRHRETGAVVMLAEGGQKIRPNGGFCWKEEADLPGAWESTFELSETAVSGHPLTAAGIVSGERVTLPFTEWEHRLSRGMDVLDLHIPAGGRMTPEACRDSFREAVAFFQAHFPQWHPTAFSCQSWIFAPELAEMLPPEMNLIRLQKEVHLYPIPAPINAGLYFLFNTADRLPEALPATATRVQRAVYDHLNAGKPWRAGGMVLLLEELPGFFAQ